MRTYNSKKELQDAIKFQITHNDAQAMKAVMRIFEYQTEDEKGGGYVYNNNGVGFMANDAYILTSFCKQYQTRGSLSPKQMDIVRKKVGKYAGQLLRLAIQRGVYIKQDGKWMVAQ